MTFAEWQWSRGMMPWTLVHDWSEAAYLQEVMRRRSGFARRRLTDPLLDAFGRVAEAVTRAALAFERLGDL